MSEQSTYIFNGRGGHSAPVIGGSLYLWAGTAAGTLPGLVVHDSPEKRKVTSTVETFSFSSARWSSHLTRGTPPLGIIAYSCTTFRSNIYYYAGWCGHDNCYYNSLNVLNTLTMRWTQLHPNDESMMKKGHAGMLSLEFDGTDYLFMVGGRGTTPAVRHLQFQYKQLKNLRVFTNEQLLYNLSNGRFTVPFVSGQCCPPSSHFTINKINKNKGIVFEGATDLDRSFTPINSIYIFKLTLNTIHWESIKNGPISGEALWPIERIDHASAIINGVSTSPALVVIGGMNNYQLVNECLLFDNITTGQFRCKKIPLPDSVTGRYHHSLTAVTMSPHSVWLVIVGGSDDIRYKAFQSDVGHGEILSRAEQMECKLITDANRLMMIIELVYNEAGEWIVQSVLDGNDLTSKKYQEEYDIYSKTRTWWMDQLIEYPTEKEMELQRYIQLLQDKLQVANQNKVSLQEALIEANKQVDDNKLVINEKLEEVLKAQVQLHEEKQILTEDNEKLRATVAYNEVYITEIEEEKKQVEEQYLKEKEITKELKTKFTDNEFYTAKLTKERGIKEASSIGLQFNYLIPSMDNLECLSDVQVAEKKLFLIQGDKPQLMNWEKYGLRIGVQEGSLLSSETVEVAVVALVGGQFQFPPNTVLVSAVYAVSLSKPFPKRLKLEIQHCVDLAGRPDLVQYLKFAIAPVSTPSLPYQFSIVEGGEFKPDSWYGSIQRTKFCLVAIVGEKHLPKSSTNGEEEEEEEQEEQAEEEAEEEVEDSNSDDSDKTKDPPGTGSRAQGESSSSYGVEKEEETGGQLLFEKENEESKDYEVPQHEEATAPIPCTEISSDFNSQVVVSTGIVENMAYAGLVYYEEKRAEDLVTFTAAKDLNALLEFIHKEHSQAEVGQNILFRFKDYDGHIELKFDAPQEKPFTGWTIEPHLKPCRFLRCDVDKFGESSYPLPLRCLISVYGSPGAVPSLHYSIPLDGVAHPKTLFIHRSQRTTLPSPLPSTNPTTSSSNVVHESTSVSSTGGASPSATVDVNKVKKAINDVLVSHYAALNSLPKKSLTGLVSHLYTAKLISNEVREAPSMEECIDEFKASLSFKRKLPQVKEHCQKFLNSFIAVRGSYADAAIALAEDWIEAIRSELGCDFNIDIDA